jgi:hypothetical protein
VAVCPTGAIHAVNFPAPKPAPETTEPSTTSQTSTTSNEERKEEQA